MRFLAPSSTSVRTTTLSALLWNIILLIPIVSTFNISPYRGAGCRSEKLFTKPFTSSPSTSPDSSPACIKGTDAAAGSGLSAIISAQTSPSSDDNAFVVFFESDDCDPDTEIGHTDGDGREAFCFDEGKGWGSFAVWDVGGDTEKDEGLGVGVGLLGTPAPTGGSVL